MQPNARPRADELGRLLETYRQAVEALKAEREALSALHQSLLQLSQQDLELHRSNTAALGALRKELDRTKRQLKRILLARA